MLKFVRNSRLITSIVLLLLFWLPLFFLSDVSQNINRATEPDPGRAISVNLSGTTTPTATIPAELIANRDQTIGIVIGGMVLILIIIIGTLSTIRRKR